MGEIGTKKWVQAEPKKKRSEGGIHILVPPAGVASAKMLKSKKTNRNSGR